MNLMNKGTVLEKNPCNGCKGGCTKGGTNTCLAWREWFKKCWHNMQCNAGVKGVK